MGAALKLQEEFKSESLSHNKWVNHKKMTELTGFTYDQMRKYRERGHWLEGKHWRFNPVRTIVYNPVEVDKWSEGKL